MIGRSPTREHPSSEKFSDLIFYDGGAINKIRKAPLRKVICFFPGAIRANKSEAGFGVKGKKCIPGKLHSLILSNQTRPKAKDEILQTSDLAIFDPIKIVLE